ncbi:hypothetical protein XELAEV_18040819mg [Xenopus laevis]|uniref:Uncharacterized protein n=1 Tax=Xenopus laevis TaxID=8355 RepID=A0A974CAG8_XENLA|nr:hypothetical protein XELAEV_18040819mg [Xenopus laevis]
MAAAGVREELTCPLCREIYRNPVTLQCDHSYCRDCIERTWDWQEGIREEPSCPECREKSPRCPPLRHDLRPSNFTESFLPIHQEQESVGISCSYCKPFVHAAKSCLLCEASLCDYHVRKHNKAEEHVLMEPTTSFGERKCSVHKKILEYHCTEDGVCICASCCLVGDHGGHKVELLSEASEKKQEQLRNVLYGLTSVKDRADRRMQSLQERRRKVQENAAEEKQRASALVEEIREYLRTLEERLMRDINEEETYNLQILSKRIQQLEIKKDELSKKMRHIEELCNMADPLTVLQERESHGTEVHGVDGKHNWGRVGNDTNESQARGQNLGLASQKLLIRLSGIVSGIRGLEDKVSLPDTNVATSLDLLPGNVATSLDLLPGNVATSLDLLPGNIPEFPEPPKRQDSSSLDYCGLTSYSVNNKGNLQS